MTNQRGKTDIERQLVTAMVDCPGYSRTPSGAGTVHGKGLCLCDGQIGMEQVPVLLGVVVERCNPFHFKAKEDWILDSPIIHDDRCCSGGGYVLAWDIGKALEWLRTKYPNVRLSSFEYYPPEKLWHVKCQPSFDALLYTGFEVEGATQDEAVQQAMLAVLQSRERTE